MESSANTKSEKMVGVAECTLNIIVNHGMPGLTFSRVARLSKVSRAWLYKYIGKTKEDLINFSVDIAGKAFAQLENVPRARDRQEWVETRVVALTKMLDDSVAHPWLVPLYYRYRGTQHALGKRMAEIEKSFLNKEVSEIVRVFKVDRVRATTIAEMLISYRLGLAYRWNWADLHRTLNKEHVLALVRQWLIAASSEPHGTK